VPNFRITSSAFLRAGENDVVEDIVFDTNAGQRLQPEASQTRSGGAVTLRARLRLAGASQTRSTGAAALRARLRLVGASQTRSTGSATLRQPTTGLRLQGVSQTRSRGTADLRFITLGQRLARARVTLTTVELRARLVEP
jgi:hypothetical protein